MIEHNRDFNIFEITCDRCSSGSAEVEADFGWHTMIEEIKGEGWSIRKDDDDWIHICPACVEAENEDPFQGLTQ